MDTIIEQRISTVIERRYNRAPAQRPNHDAILRQTRTARGRLTAELHRLCAKVAGAVADLNDRLRDTDIWLEIEHIDRSPASDAIYQIRIAGDEDPILIFTVDWMGNLRGILKNRDTRSLLHAYSNYCLTSADIMDMLVSLLESHYH